MKKLGPAIVAIFAIGAVSATSAPALPEVGRCVATSGGKYWDANCIVKAAKGKGTFEFLKGATKAGFTAAGGETVLETAEGVKFSCLSESATGKYDVDTGVIKGVEAVVMTFTDCELPLVGGDCETKGVEQIVTSALRGNLGYITSAPEVGLELTPEVKSQPYAEFECGSGSVLLVIKAAKTNCIISSVLPTNAMSSTLTQKYSASTKGQQAVTHFEKTPTKLCQLEISHGASAELMSQSVEATITNEEALEVRA